MVLTSTIAKILKIIILQTWTKNVLSLLMTHAPIITNVKMGPLV